MKKGSACRYLLLVAFLVSSLCPVLSQAPPCTADDFQASYTECTSGNTRNLVYYLKPDANCSGGYTAPSNVYGLPCGIACPPGSHLPLGKTQCAACGEGTFSIGGGYKIDTWYEWPEPDYFRRYRYNSSYSAHITTGPQWNLQKTYIRSGNISDSQTSVLELSVYIASTVGHVTFSYRVNAEGSATLAWDGLQFSVDGTVLVPKISHTINFVTVTFPLSFGAHILTWAYIKDQIYARGEDAAFIRMIEIGGLKFADDFCEECLEGTYNPNTNSTSCLPCPPNTFSNTTGVSVCTSCTSDQYSYSEAATCLPRLACTADDYEQFFTACNGVGRTLQSRWITPVICDVTSPNSVQLPPDEIHLCGDCSDGSHRSPTTYACEYCTEGYYSNSSTYDANGPVCQPCPAGTAAVKTFAVTQFDDWIAGSTTSCSGDCSDEGWLLHSSYMSSGVGHGSVVNSLFTFNVTLVADGVLTFKYAIVCPSQQCSLTLNLGTAENLVYPAPAPLTNSSVPLLAGNHSLTWTFSKYDYGLSRNDSANIYSIVITSTSIGGATSCVRCASGSYAPNAQSTQCLPCPAGKQSNSDGTGCAECPEGQYNPTAGGTCIPCGLGTVPLANRTGCDISCKYSPDGKAVYDLNPLRSNVSYGPIVDKAKQKYYINICSTTPHQCYSSKTTTIDSYSCQETVGKIAGTDIPEGKDTGHVFAWYPLPNDTLYNTNIGVVMRLEMGDTGCAASNGGVAKHRNTTIAFLCDPSAGAGVPVANGNIENVPCSYSFIWRSLYACPVCSVDEDMSFYFSPCQNSQRIKTYYWLQNPPLCHGGVLPEPTVVDCSETLTVCPAGQYLKENEQCGACRAGSFSVGGGERILTWNPTPTRFSSDCQPTSTGGACTKWGGDEDGIETISSGTGTSFLSSSFDFVVAGSVSFLYKVYSPNVGRFTFTIDGIEQLNLATGTNILEWTNATFSLSKGIHMFSWTFYSGSDMNSATARIGAVLKDVTVIGTDYHDDACTPCPAGFRSDAGAASCIACGADQYSASDDSVCSSCSNTTTSLPKSSKCVIRPNCAVDDIVVLHSECVNNTRTATYSYLQPKYCISDQALPDAKEVPCAPCLPGSFPEPTDPSKCTVCPEGEYYTNGKCEISAAGSMVVKRLYYFYDNSTSSWPSVFSTSCSGDCGSSGWRIRGDSIDSGYHGSNGVDSLVKLQVSVTSRFASISFSYMVTPSNSLDLYLDDSYYNSYFSSTPYSVTVPLHEGNHTITWNYHQHRLNSGHAVLSEIIVVGATSPTASGDVSLCPAGSYSEAGFTNCTLCPPGSFSASNGSSVCELCPAMTYNSEYGAAQCLACNGDSYSEKGAQYCINECLYSAVINDIEIYFGLEAYDNVGPIRALNSSFYFNFCNASLVDAPCNPNKPSHVCAVEDTGIARRDWGGYLNFEAKSGPVVSGSKNNTFTLSFANGDLDGCEPGIARSALVSFYCDVGKTGLPIFVPQGSDQCTANFEWTGLVGCPVCESSDYDTLLGPCVDGMRTVQHIRKSACNGAAVKPAPSQSCSGTVEFPIAVVFVVIGVVLVVIIAAVVVFIKNRRISAQYSRLKHQTDNTASVMDNEL